MDYVWTPWRYAYIKDAGRTDGCVLCGIAKARPEQDEDLLVVCRGDYNFIVLNRYPYTNGHAMVVPYLHVATLTDAEPDVLAEMMRLTQRTESVQRRVYRADGINVGMNIGAAAGAGVAGHIHMHVLPRWGGDSNFMTAIGETRILPEDLNVTWKRLRAEFED